MEDQKGHLLRSMGISYSLTAVAAAALLGTLILAAAGFSPLWCALGLLSLTYSIYWGGIGQSRASSLCSLDFEDLDASEDPMVKRWLGKVHSAWGKNQPVYIIYWLACVLMAIAVHVRI